MPRFDRKSSLSVAVGTVSRIENALELFDSRDKARSESVSEELNSAKLKNPQGLPKSEGPA